MAYGRNGGKEGAAEASDMGNGNMYDMGKERMGYYPKKPHDGNFSWMWTVAFAMCTGFFLIQFALQRAGMIDPPIVREKPGGPAKAAVPDAKTDIVEA